MISFWFVWKFVIMLIDIYYINECFLWLTFEGFYNYAKQQLLAFNIVLLFLLFLHCIFKIMMTPKLPESIFSYMGKHTKRLLYLEYICRYNFNLFNILMFISFFTSFILSYEAAGWIHGFYTLKVIEVDNFLSVIYTRIYTWKAMRVIYRIVMLTFIILYISHLIAIVFYEIDKYLINRDYFGNPIENHKCIYHVF